MSTSRTKRIRQHVATLRATNPSVTYTQAAADLGLQERVRWSQPVTAAHSRRSDTGWTSSLRLAVSPQHLHHDQADDPTGDDLTAVWLPSTLFSPGAAAPAVGTHVTIVSPSPHPARTAANDRHREQDEWPLYLLHTIIREAKTVVGEGNDLISGASSAAAHDPDAYDYPHPFWFFLGDEWPLDEFQEAEGTRFRDPRSSKVAWAAICNQAESNPDRLIVVYIGDVNTWATSATARILHEHPNIATLGMTFDGRFEPWSQRGIHLDGRKPLQELTIRFLTGQTRVDGTRYPDNSFMLDDGDTVYGYRVTGDPIYCIRPKGHIGFLGPFEAWRALGDRDAVRTFEGRRILDSDPHLDHPSPRELDAHVVSTADDLHLLLAQHTLAPQSLRSSQLHVVQADAVLRNPSDRQAFKAFAHNKATRFHDIVVFAEDPTVFIDLDWPVWTLPEC